MGSFRSSFRLGFLLSADLDGAIDAFLLRVGRRRAAFFEGLFAAGEHLALTLHSLFGDRWSRPLARDRRLVGIVRHGRVMLLELLVLLHQTEQRAAHAALVALEQ